MTPKEKAIELIKSFYPHVQWKLGQEDCLDRAKQCALILVYETKEALKGFSYGMEYITNLEYWLEVEQEILNLKKL